MPSAKRTNTNLLTEDIVRVPLVGVYNTRNLDSSSYSTTTTNGIVGTGVVGVMIVGSTTGTTKDQRFVNCFCEKISSPQTGSSKFYVTKRPGWAVLNTPESGSTASAIKAWSVSNNEVISAFGDTNSHIYNGVTDLGAITGVATFIEETSIGGTPYLVVPSDDNTAWYSTGGAPAQITDTDFPGEAGRTITGNFVFVDGYAFIMDTSGRIYNSDLNSVTAWTADSYIAANMYPDKGIGLARYKNLIVGFGEETIEFFIVDGNNPIGTPLSRYEQGFVHFGCINQFAYAQLEDTVAWVSASDRSGIGVYILDGLQPKRISIPTIDTQLSLVSSSSVIVNVIKIFGKSFVVVITSSNTFVYSLEDDIWHEWNGPATLWQKITGTSSGTRLVYAVSTTDTGGNVFIINPSSITYQDNGSNYNMIIQTSKFDGDSINWKFLNKLSIVGDQATATCPLAVQWSDDDYQNWSTARNIDMVDDVPYIKNCGKFRRRAFKFTNSTNLPVRLEAVELELKLGSH